jgi:glycosyltransferase involved in cell wall biosynthesis
LGATEPLPRLSIVVPSYNQGRYLERCLRSILDQDYPGLELIVIDGGSTDETPAILTRHAARIAHAVSERDRGQADALNKGFALASGEIFGWQNADDAYLPGALRSAGALFAARPDLQVAYGHYQEIDPDDRVQRVYYALAPRPPAFAYATCDIATQALFWRRTAHASFGTFDISYERCMDSQLKLHFLSTYRPPAIERVDATWGAFRRHPAQKTRSDLIDPRNLEEEERLARQFGYGSGSSLGGRANRLAYRGRQMANALAHGGVRYTIERLATGFRRRGGLL